MTVESTAGARLASWWAVAITRTAEREAAKARRAEVASDVHDELTAALERGDLARGSRSVIGRVVRGMPADLAWRVAAEVQPGRLPWHLRNPSTAITALFLMMLPLNLVADSARGPHSRFIDYRVPLWALTDVVGCGILALAAVSALERVRPRWGDGAQTVAERPRLEALRRGATTAMGVAWAGSAVFRFGAPSRVGSLFWGAFGVCLLLYLLLLVVTIAARALTLRRYLPKLSS